MGRMCFLLILHIKIQTVFVCASVMTSYLSSLTLLSFFTGTLGGLFSQILQGEDVVRERAIKFLSTKLKTMPDDTMTKEVEDYIFIETKKVSFIFPLSTHTLPFRSLGLARLEYFWKESLVLITVIL